MGGQYCGTQMFLKALSFDIDSILAVSVFHDRISLNTRFCFTIPYNSDYLCVRCSYLTRRHDLVVTWKDKISKFLEGICQMWDESENIM